MAAPRPIKGILKNKTATKPCTEVPFESTEPTGSGFTDDDQQKKSQKWDEMNILATYHPADKDYGLMKIDEPSTPYNRMVGEDDDEVHSDSEGNAALTVDDLTKKLTAAEGSGPRCMQEEEEDEESSEEEEELSPEEQAKKKQFEMMRKMHYNEGLNIKMARQLIARELQEEDDEEEDEEMKDDMETEDINVDPPQDEEEVPPAKATKAPATKAAPAKKAAAAESDDDDDEDESEEEPPKKTAPAKSAKAIPAKATPVKAKAAPAKKEESDDDDDDDDDESEEEEAPAPKKAAPAKPSAKAAPPKPAAKAAPAEEESEDEDEDDDSEEEEMDTTPAPTKKAAVKKAKEESEEEEEDDDDEEEEDDDDEEEDEDEDGAPVTPGKRKADVKKEKGTPPAKKAKSDGEAVSLFMGNLNSEKSFEEIKEGVGKFFKKEGLVIQDVRLGGSKKFGYVDFATEEELQKALGLNGKKFMGLAIKLDRARSKEDSQESKKERDARTLFVKNLPYSATSDDLKEIFDQAMDIRIPVGHNGTSRGIAYIEFKTEAIAEKMLEETQGSDVQGRSIMVDFTGAKSRQSSKGPTSGPANKVLVVNNLAFSATEESLQNVFEKAVAIRIPQNNGRPKGYAFVEFENTDDAKEAMDSCNNTDIEGRSIRLEFSQNRGEGGGRGGSGPTKTLFVKGLSDETTDQTLRDAFEGAVAARIATDKDTGSCKGYGFVDFDSEEDCKAAKEAMDDAEIDGNKVTLDYAKPKGEGGRGGGRGGFGGRGGGRGGFGGRDGGRGGFRGGRGGGGYRGGGRGGFR
ncbi:nucleolin, partial [Clarias magur]